MPPLASCSSPRHSPSKRSTPHARRPHGKSTARNRELVTARPIAAYVGTDGRRRELLAIPGHAGTVLVLDRDAATLCDRRLVAHLAADEPVENAVLVCTHYLNDASGRWCRRVRPHDLSADPLSENPPDARALDVPESPRELIDRNGNVYSIGLLPGERSTAQLRWRRRPAGANERCERVALRDVIAAFESYEPMRSLTEQVLASHREDGCLVVTRLRNEFERLCTSPVVLNRGLREAVVHAVDRGLSMSEIAVRCGFVKRGKHGKAGGETSWLSRRIGVMPEGGEKDITPWVHTDVLALIARKGLGISPREVELQ